MFLNENNIKIFYCIDSFNGCLVFQDDLINMVHWAEKLGLQFNTTKCHSMTFTHLKPPTMFDYVINKSVLQSFDKSVNDLRIIFYHTL